uniref:F-box domain-containing protein n=1 Tax=Brassica oleracea var. oleracea TaxID=109376 RepID=A0A0D3CLE4_BRAOL
MENKEKLPWELVEEILSRVPPKPVVRFRTVCKRWNALFDDNTFINNHKLTFRFILLTKAKVYSVSLNPEIEVSELTLDIPGLNNQKPNDLVDCNGLLLCGTKEGAVVCNPWSGQNRCIKAEVSQTSLEFRGIGYDGNRIGKKIVYKTLAFYLNNIRSSTSAWRIHDLATDKWKRVLKEVKGETRPQNVFIMHSTRGVSLNGNLYWVAYCLSHPSLLLVVSFDFGSGKYLNFCGLPCVENDHSDALVLRVFRGDRFSLLKQCHVTKKIQIWVAKDKIDNGHSRDVKWMSFMEVSIPDLPYLVQTQSYHQPSYFIEDKWDVSRKCLSESSREDIYFREQRCSQYISGASREIIGVLSLKCIKNQTIFEEKPAMNFITESSEVSQKLPTTGRCQKKLRKHDTDRRSILSIENYVCRTDILKVPAKT